MPKKLCKDCAFVSDPKAAEDEAICQHENAAHPVSGAFNTPCYVMRDLAPHHCQPDGKWFRARAPIHLFSTPPELPDPPKAA